MQEARHFAGAQTLTEQDILEARQFTDWAVYGSCSNFRVMPICIGSGWTAGDHAPTRFTVCGW